MRVALPSTVAAVKKAHKRLKTLGAVIDAYDVPVSKGTLSRILRGAEGVSVNSDVAVRRALGVGSTDKPCLRPRLPIDPALRIAKLTALLRQAEAELQESA